MAIIQYTGVVNQLRGKLNGSVFNKSRTVFTLQRKQQNPRRNVGFQFESRNIFSTAQRTWKTLNSTQQAQWALAAANNPSRNRFGDLVALSGYNQYIKAFIFATYANRTPPTTPDTSPAPAVNVTSSSLEGGYFFIGSGGTPFFGYDLGLSGTGGGTDYRALLDIGLPISRGVTVYYGRYTFIDASVYNSGASWIGETDLGSRYPYPQSGQRFSVRARVVYIPNGSVVFDESVITAVAF